jgi:hypothetical protein
LVSIKTRRQIYLSFEMSRAGTSESAGAQAELRQFGGAHGRRLREWLTKSNKKLPQ